MVLWYSSPKKTLERCPCCDNFSIVELGGYEICDSCGWEDDPVQSADPALDGGANDNSLQEVRSIFFANKLASNYPDCFAICRICGFEPKEGVNICPCCGFRFGYEDTILSVIKSNREKWLASGAQWFSEKEKPLN